MKRVEACIRSLLADESGATMLEYAIMIALVATACVTAVTALGLAIKGKFTAAAGFI